MSLLTCMTRMQHCCLLPALYPVIQGRPGTLNTFSDPRKEIELLRVIYILNVFQSITCISQLDKTPQL